MARPQKYKQAQVMGAVSELFQSQGYRATSIDQLLEVSQLSRSSLYHGFGNKEALYLLVLDQIAIQTTTLYKNLATSSEPELFLRLFFQSYRPDDSAHAPGQGCLLVNTVVELADSEPALVERALEYLKLAEVSLAKYFNNAQLAKQLPQHLNPVALAKYFMNVKKGLMVSVRHGASLHDLTDVIETSLLILKATNAR